MSRLPIACAINDSYVLPLAVMLTSLKARLRPDVRPALHLLHTGLTESSLRVIHSLVETHSIVPSTDQIAEAPHSSRFPCEASFPLLLATALPDIERVLFLDADMLVMDDVGKLWDTSLDGRVLGAATDGAIPTCAAARGVKGWQTLGIPPAAPYFNGGVLLLDLEAWRARDVSGRVRRYLNSTSQIDYLHQEALNAVLWNDWHRLDPRWNLLASRAGRWSDASEDWRSPGIVHFAGRAKPWRGPVGGPFNEPYQRMLDTISVIVPKSPVTTAQRWVSVYDRHLRAAFDPLERFLWKRRLF
jgi:lipopolysaccharide biosynthesis glycosyltransferase